MGSVELEGGIASVDVQDSIATLGGDDRRLAVAQIVYTLTARPGVGQVSFTLEGAPVDVPRADGSLVARPVSRDDHTAALVDDVCELVRTALARFASPRPFPGAARAPAPSVVLTQTLGGPAGPMFGFCRACVAVSETPARQNARPRMESPVGAPRWHHGATDSSSEVASCPVP